MIYIDRDGNVTRKAEPSKDVDLNGDGIINLVDARILLNYCNEDGTLTDEQKTKADINEDGEISLNDAILLIKYVNGLIDDVVNQ